MADHKRKVLVCDNDEKVLASIKAGLIEHHFEVEIITRAEELVENAESHHVGAVLVNPDMPGFNAHDICKYLKKNNGMPVLLLVDPHSTTRISLDGCDADEIITKPVKMDDLAFILNKHMVLSHS